MRFNPFANVYCRYGSPMGRYSAPGPLADNVKLCARHQGGDQGYDRGGAYWGYPANVWAVWEYGRGSETVKYIRASSRESAIQKAMED